MTNGFTNTPPPSAKPTNTPLRPPLGGNKKPFRFQRDEQGGNYYYFFSCHSRPRLREDKLQRESILFPCHSRSLLVIPAKAGI